MSGKNNHLYLTQMLNIIRLFASNFLEKEKINLLTNFNEGEMIEVFFNLSSKEYNGRYFHNIDAWKIQQINNEIYDDEPPPVFENDLDKEDDLPF